MENDREETKKMANTTHRHLGDFSHEERITLPAVSLARREEYLVARLPSQTE
jgi:hypothetical protein